MTMVFKAYLDFTIVCPHGPDCLVVYAEYNEAVADYTEWFARRINVDMSAETDQKINLSSAIERKQW